MKQTAYRLADIVARFGGRVVGDGDTLVAQIGTLDSAAGDRITFLANSRYRAQLAITRAGAVILGICIIVAVVVL